MLEIKDHIYITMSVITFMATIIGVVVWLVRLEAGMKQNAEGIRALWRQRSEDLESAKQARAETNQLLHSMNDKMDSAFTEFRNDIKQLLIKGTSK